MGPVAPSRAHRLPPRKRGFTLIEILVVLAIVAIAGGIAAVLLTPDERGVALREARRFAGAIEYAAARAQSRAETLGVSATNGQVRFWRRDPADPRWREVVDDETLAPHALPPPLSAAAYAYAGQRVRGDVVVPLRPSGRNEPFAFVLSSPSWRVGVVADPLMQVALDGPVAVAP